MGALSVSLRDTGFSRPDHFNMAHLQEYCREKCTPEILGKIFIVAETAVKNIPLSDAAENLSTSPSLPIDLTPRFLFAKQVRCAIAEEPVEAGYQHAAEDILAKALTNQPEDVESWLQYLLDFEKNEGLVADILTCFGHAISKTPPDWAFAVMDDAIRHSSVGVRDVAAQTLELWSSPEALAVLRQHEEPVPWLKDYIEKVIELLERM
jgi:hypothetical protein